MLNFLGLREPVCLRIQLYGVHQPETSLASLCRFYFEGGHCFYAQASYLLLCCEQIVVGLHVDPQFNRCTQSLSNPNGSIGGYSALPIDDFIESGPGDTCVLSESCLCDFSWLEILFVEYFSWVNDNFYCGHAKSPLFMVIGDAHVVCTVLGPLKNDTVLLVDADAIKTFKASSEFFEVVSRRKVEILNLFGVFKHEKFALS